MIYGIAGIVVVLLVLLIWLNVYWARQLPKPKDRGGDTTSPEQKKEGFNPSKEQPHRRSERSRDRREKGERNQSSEQGQRRQQTDTAGPLGSNADSGEKEAVQDSHRRWGRGEAEQDSARHRERGHTAPEMRHEQQREPQNEEVNRRHPSHDAPAPPPDEESSVEVLQKQTGKSEDSIFGQSRTPYYLNEVNVPEFVQPAWAYSFEYLKDHSGVLGWIAFSEETVGASDRKYDDDFLDALRAYRRSTDRLQKQVGLSRVVETSIVGDEGKVWLLTVIDEIWFALFIDRETDSWALTKELLEVHSNA